MRDLNSLVDDWQMGCPTPLLADGLLYRTQFFGEMVASSPLMSASKPLLVLSAMLKRANFQIEAEQLWNALVHEVRAFDHQALLAGYDKPIVLAARYGLCCLLDELINLTIWDESTFQAKRSLLKLFHGDIEGGERFFQMVEQSLLEERSAQQSETTIQSAQSEGTNLGNLQAKRSLLELWYLILNLGFKGSYGKTAGGEGERMLLINRLYQALAPGSWGKNRNLLVAANTAEGLKRNPVTVKAAAVPVVTESESGERRGPRIPRGGVVIGGALIVSLAMFCAAAIGLHQRIPAWSMQRSAINSI